MKIPNQLRNWRLVTLISLIAFFTVFGSIRYHFSINPYIPEEYMLSEFTIYKVSELPCHPIDLFCHLGKALPLAFTMPGQVTIGEVFAATWTNEEWHTSNDYFHVGSYPCSDEKTCYLEVIINGVSSGKKYTKYSGIVGCFATTYFSISPETGVGSYPWTYEVKCYSDSFGWSKESGMSGTIKAIDAPPVCGDGRCTKPYECEQGVNCDNPCKADCGEVVSICGNGKCDTSLGESCTSCPSDCGACQDNCEPLHHHYACKGTAVYWMDACGEYNDFIRQCQYGCNNGICVQCYPNQYTVCVGNDVYWSDSCGNRGTYVQTCPSDNVCSSGKCIPSVTCRDDCDWAGTTKCYDIDRDGVLEIVPCVLSKPGDTDPCKDFGTANECGAGTSCVDRPGGARCESTCANECTIPGYTCLNENIIYCSADIDSDPCLDVYIAETCKENEICQDAQCIPKEPTCIDECNPSSYPQCDIDGLTTIQCTDLNLDGCTELWNSICGEGYYCEFGECIAGSGTIPKSVCGNNICEHWFGENKVNCYSDCSKGIQPKEDYTIYIIGGLIIGVIIFIIIGAKKGLLKRRS